MENHQLSDLLNIAIIASLNAGKEILEVYSNADLRIEYKADNSPLTIADKNAHRSIIQILKSTNIPVLSEEGAAIEYKERSSWPLFWLIDPLDGTKEFINKNGEFTVNIALIENGVPILGVIFAPVLKKIYYASNNQSFLFEEINLANSENEILVQIQQNSISLPIQNQKEAFVVLASRSHLSDETNDYIEKLIAEKYPVELLSIGSSLKLCVIAEGRADLYPRFSPTMEWDIAAGHAIVEASGGSVLQVANGKPLTYNKKDLLNPWFIVSK
ncbi:MAG: 3'(2'),5'-bisphosphate nucleotidase CysQ [Bacteroidales bacterium]|nr:3'(2'),5'-bisphosphate nucleotidase CysQ [Bacteroidales bacterium]